MIRIPNCTFYVTETMTDKYDDPRRTAREARKDYHLRNVVLDEELVERIFQWHGGQNTMTYSLASTGLNDFVSPSMCDAAADELAQAPKHPLSPEDEEDRHDLWATLQDLADYPDENTAEHMGCSTSDSGYATWLMTEPAWMTPPTA
jgi:hypothetical protein